VLAPDRSTYYAPINPDGTVGNWAETTLLPYVISLYASFENNGFLYTVGGNSPSVQYVPVASDHALGQWQPTKSLPEPRSGLRVGANNCVVYAVGGYESSYRDTVYLAQLLSPLPVADLIAAPLTGAAPLTVTFTDLSTGAVANRLWVFGDGITSTLQNPTHVYHQTGNYTVTLTVTGPSGNHTLTLTSFIAVTPLLTPRVYLPLITR
jgi:PKD repeat protein